MDLSTIIRSLNRTETPIFQGLTARPDTRYRNIIPLRIDAADTSSRLGILA